MPSGPVDDSFFSFSASTVPRAEPSLWTANVWTRLVHHDYNDSFRREGLDFQLGRATARSLGCLIFARLFHESPVEICVELRHPTSRAKRLVIDFPTHSQASETPGLTVLPLRYGYYPSEPARLALSDHTRTPWDLPWFEFTNEGRCVTTDAQREARDTVILSGSAEGLSALAALLLDAGRPKCRESEFVLEDCSAGLGGVAPSSAEARFWLPGSLLWDLTDLADPPLAE